METTQFSLCDERLVKIYNLFLLPGKGSQRDRLAMFLIRAYLIQVAAF